MLILSFPINTICYELRSNSRLTDFCVHEFYTRLYSLTGNDNLPSIIVLEVNTFYTSGCENDYCKVKCRISSFVEFLVNGLIFKRISWD